MRAHGTAPPAVFDVVAGFVALAAATLVIIATRGGLRMSPDSITYLSVADHLRSGRGLTDFTGEGLTVFGPVQPLLFAPGGRSVMWARLVSSAGVAAATVLQYALLRQRTRPWIAVTAAVVLGAGECLLLVASSAYSETPYIALSLAVLVVLLPRPTIARCAAAGALAGLGFLTRYAGASLIVTGAVVILVADRGAARAQRWRPLATYLATAGVLAGSWVVHNLVVSGQPLGPRFEGGTSDPWNILLRRPFTSLGHTLLGDSLDVDSATTVGAVAVIMIVVAALVWQHRGAVDALRAGMLVYAATNFVMPVVARALTSNDISSRVMSPMMIPIVYVTAVAADAVVRVRVGIGVVALLAALWVWQGLALVERVPQMASSGSRTAYSPELHDLVDELSDDAQVLTNNPWGVWWQNQREPTLFAFTRPRPGNSHFPISGERTLMLACTRPTYLAWFPALMNAGDGPDERRPDLLQLVDLDLQHEVTGGQLYRVVPLDGATCAT